MSSALHEAFSLRWWLPQSGHAQFGLSGCTTQPPRTISARSSASLACGEGYPYTIGTCRPAPHWGQRTSRDTSFIGV
jgi:hypothetical protein